MRRVLKQLAAFAASIAMMFTMSANVFADGTTTANLTINGTEGSQYQAYQVMTAEKIGDNLYSYKVTSDFEAAFPIKDDKDNILYDLDDNNQIVDADGNKIASDGLGTNTNTTDASKIAGYLSDYASDKGISGTEIAVNTAAELPIGYYVIRQSAVPSGEIASKPILVALTSDVEITAKKDTVPLDKTITSSNQDASGDTNTAKIGDTVTYEVTTTIPSYGNDVDKTSLVFKLTDTFSTGLTYQKDVKVNVNSSEVVASTDTYTISQSEQGFVIEFKPDYIWEHQNEPVKLVYSGILNKNAVVNSTDGNPNTIKLDYTHGPDNVVDSKEDKVTTYSFGIGIEKVDKATQEKLDGAKFTIQGSDGKNINLVKISETEYRVATADDTDTTDTIIVNSTKGAPVIKGLDAGTYTLTETTPPDSYSVVSPITVKIEANTDATTGKYTGTASISASCKTEQIDEDGDATINTDTKVTAQDGKVDINVYVEDTKGISLPETGSQAAMLLMLGGALLIVVGGAYIVISGRKNQK